MTTEQSYIPFWHSDPTSWDTVYLAGDALPGLNEISSLKGGKRKIDKKGAPNADGATYQDKGYEPATFTIVCRIFQPVELNGLITFFASITPKKGEKLKSFSVKYPLLDLLGIDVCIIEDVTVDFNKDSQILEAKLSCSEFKPLQKGKGGKVAQAKDHPALTSVPAVQQPGFKRDNTPGKTIRPPKP